MRWLLLLLLVAGCSGGAEGPRELFVYIVDGSGEPPEGIELRFDAESSRMHPPGSDYTIGSFKCAPQVGMGEERAAVGMLCSGDEASSNIRVTMNWRECASATVEGSLILGERVLDYWLRCEREAEARRIERGIEPTELNTR